MGREDAVGTIFRLHFFCSIGIARTSVVRGRHLSIGCLHWMAKTVTITPSTMTADSKEIIVSVVIAAVGILLWYLKNEYGEKRTKLSNGQVLVRPARLPFLGAAWGLSPDNFIEVFAEFYRKYGDLVEIYLGPQRVIVITDVEICKEVLNLRPKIFRRTRSFEYPAQQLGYDHSLFFSNGNQWNMARRLTAPSFNKENVANQIENIWDMAQRWAENIKATSSGSVIDFRFVALEFTLGVITKIVCGVDRDRQQDSYFNKPLFVKDFQLTFTFFMESIMFPISKFFWRLSPWHYGKYEVPAVEGDQRFIQACSELIDEHKKKIFAQTSVSDSAAANTTLLGTMLKKAERDQISDNDVVSNAKLFFLAGSETTSIGICFAMYYLALHPDIRDKVREESDRFAALMQDYSQQSTSDDAEGTAKKSSTDLYEMVFTQLPWSEAVFKECIRLQPPASFLAITLESETSSYTLSNGLTIGPKDELSILLENALHCSDDNYDDAALFKPERWLDPDPAKRQKAELNFVAFGGGPRVCPGMKLAMIEGILAVTALVQHLDWTLACDPSEIKRVLLFSSTPNKMPLRITGRVNK